MLLSQNNKCSQKLNTIVKLKVREEIVTNPEEEVKKEIKDFYEKLYSKTAEWRAYIEMRDCPMIDEEDNNQLMAPFEAQEILENIKVCARDKAPCPDCFSTSFF